MTNKVDDDIVGVYASGLSMLEGANCFLRGEETPEGFREVVEEQLRKKWGYTGGLR